MCVIDNQACCTRKENTVKFAGELSLRAAPLSISTVFASLAFTVTINFLSSYNVWVACMDVALIV